MTANKDTQSSKYTTTVTWADGHEIKYDPETFEVEGYTKVTDVWPSESSIKLNLEKRKALGGGESYPYRYLSMSRQDWYVDFEAKAFWAEDNV